MTTLDKDAVAAARKAFEMAGEDDLEQAITAYIDALSSIPEQGVKRFPVLNSGGAAIDWRLVDDHGVQALKNHYQTVQRLAERGGLSWSELYAVLHDKPFRMMDTNDAITACRALEARYLAALVAPSRPAAVGVKDQFRQLRGAIERITQEISVTARELRDGNTPDEFSKGWDAALDQVEDLVRNHSPHGLEAHRLVDALEAALRSTP